jgi:hypothetical protein
MGCYVLQPFIPIKEMRLSKTLEYICHIVYRRIPEYGDLQSTMFSSIIARQICAQSSSSCFLTGRVSTKNLIINQVQNRSSLEWWSFGGRWARKVYLSKAFMLKSVLHNICKL